MPIRKALLVGTAGLWMLAGTAQAGELLRIPAENLGAALDTYIRRTGVQLIYNVDDVKDAQSREVTDLPRDAALDRLLDGTGLQARRDLGGAIIITRIVPPLADFAGLTPTETVTVTGSRILGGEELTTPVVAVSADQLLSTTPAGIPEALNKLPIFTGGSTPNNATTGANGRGNNTPGYFLNLRNLGAIRTLILEDGHRVPGTFYDTTVDVDMLPQMLVSRVEVVSGGASAVYGSDAVTGVVNFILDRDFQGFKAVVQGGISGYGDAKSLRLGAAGGVDIGSQGHLIWSAEYYNRAALPDAAARPLGNLGTSIVGAGTAASPYLLVTNIRQSNSAPGGLIVSGPGKGLQFLSDGGLAPFNAGSATPTANLAIGGDGGIEHNEYLLPVFSTGQAFAHYDQKLGNITATLEARYALSRTHEAGQIFADINGSGLSLNGSGAIYPLTIHSGNAFLTPAEQAFLFSPGAADSFQMNRMDNDLMNRLNLDQHTGALALRAGLEGTLWGGAWDLSYTHGETRNQLTTRNNIDTARFYAALDAVRDPQTGNIVCQASLAAPGAFPGCVPLNLFGQSASVINGSNASQAALNYISSTTWWTARNGLDDVSANLSGTGFEGPAGPVKVALGLEYRMADLAVDTSTPNDIFNPQYLRLAPAGTFCPVPGSLASCQAALANGTHLASADGTFPPADLANFKEVLSGARGSENISEANVEVNAPLLRNLPGIDLFSVTGAARYTSYKVGGQDPRGGGFTQASFSAITWKLGGEWQIDDDLKLRATRSRDIRAPTLWDLFQGAVTTASGISDSLTGMSGSANTLMVGNPALKPEVARNTTAGLVYTPGWLAGLHVTLDYFHIAIDREISVLSGGNPVVQSACLASGGFSSYCTLIQRPISYNDPSPQNFPTLFYAQPQNFQSQWTEGVDLDVNYQTDLAGWSGLPGLLGVRLLWTHTATLKTRGLAGSVITDVAGSANAPANALPTDKVALMLRYALDGFTLDVMERYYSPLRPNPNPTLIYAPGVGYLSSWFQTDINLARDFSVRGIAFSGYLNVNNLLDAKPGIFQVPNYAGSPGMNYPVVPYEDIIGRYFTLGLRCRI